MHTSSRLRLWILASCLALASCGGASDGANTPAAQPPSASAAAAPLRAATVALTATALMDWAERQYPDAFPGHQADQSQPPYVYRHYPNGNYLGVADGRIYIMGPVAGGMTPASVGTLNQFSCRVQAGTCPVLPAPATDLAALRGATLLPDSTWQDATSIRRRGVTVLPDNGANAIRILLSPFDIATSATLLPGRPLSEKIGLTLDQWASNLVPWARGRGMNVIFSFHLDTTYPANNAWPDNGRTWLADSAQAEIVDAWAAMARRYAGMPGIVFDIVDEPHGITTQETDNNGAVAKAVLNTLYPKALAAIRAIDPQRWVVLQPVWADSTNFNALTPLPDSRVMYSFHAFRPHFFTHQSNNVIPGYPVGGTVLYPGVTQDAGWETPKYWDRAALEAADFKPAADYAEKYGVRMMMGDGGSLRSAPAQSRYNWTADMLALSSQHGFDTVYYQYDGWGVPTTLTDGWAFEHSNIEPLLFDFFARRF